METFQELYENNNDSLKEDWYKTVDSGVDVIKNPSMFEVKKEFKDWAFAGVRAILTLDGKNLYCWDADKMLHSDMIKYLGLRKENIVTLHLLIAVKAIMVTATTSITFTSEEKDLYEDVVRNSKAVSNLMGGDFKIVF